MACLLLEIKKNPGISRQELLLLDKTKIMIMSSYLKAFSSNQGSPKCVIFHWQSRTFSVLISFFSLSC